MLRKEIYIIKTLLKSLKGNKVASITTIILSALEVVFEIVIPLCMSNLLDFGIYDSNMNKVWIYGCALIILAFLELLAGILSAKFGAKASAGYAATLRKNMYNNVENFSFSNIDKFSTASIVTRLTTDVTNVQNAYQMIIRMAIRGPIMMIFAMIVSFSINNTIALIFLAAIPFLSIFLLLIIRAVNPIFKKVFATYDNLNNVVEENVKGIRVVKSYNQENHEISKFDKISQKIYQNFAKGEKLIAFNSSLMQFTMYAVMILISWIGAQAIVASGNNSALGLTTGNLTALISYAQQILTSLMMLSMVFAMISIASSSATRCAEILNEKPNITNSLNPIKDIKDGSVSFKNVTFSYSSTADKNVLTNINIDIPSGSSLGIIGATGSSKSSLVQLIPRLYDVTDGEVLVSGKTVKDYDITSLRTAVGIVLQKNELFSGTIKENIKWGNENATDDEIKEVCHVACADEFIDSLPDGYDTYIDQGGTNVSGGQKQRLCIARALLKKPKILIMDDSTSAVDTKTDAKIEEAFKGFLPNTTKIIIAQRISSIKNCDNIIVMDDGKIIAKGKHDELIKNCSIYKEINDSQNKKGGEQNGKNN